MRILPSNIVICILLLAPDIYFVDGTVIRSFMCDCRRSNIRCHNKNPDYAMRFYLLHLATVLYDSRAHLILSKVRYLIF